MNKCDSKNGMKTDVLILAAGLGRRFNGNKMMHVYEGKPMVGHCLDLCATLLDKGLVNSVTVVTNNIDTDINSSSVASYVKSNHPNYILVSNPRPEEGMSSSIRLGVQKIKASQPKSESLLILLGDMPNLTLTHITSLLYEIQKPDIEIAVSHETGSHEEDFRNPVIISSKYYDSLLLLSGDHGAKKIITAQYHKAPHTLGIVDTDSVTLADVDKHV